MTARVVAAAAGLFAVTNVDDLVLLSLYFGRSAGQQGSGRRIVAGQYLGFTALLAVTAAAAFGASFLPQSAIPYLGVLPLVLGLRAGWLAWRRRQQASGGQRDEDAGRQAGPWALQVAAVTFANGSDNIGAYTPVITESGAGEIAVYAAVSLVLVGVWCAAGRFFATRPAVAGMLSRWGDLLHPLVLVALGLYILIEGNAFGL